MDACVSPVVDIDELGNIKHHQKRGSFMKQNNKYIPLPAPRFYTREEFESLRAANNRKFDS